MHGSALCKQSEDVEQDLRHEIAPSVEVVERAVPVESDGNLLSVGHLRPEDDCMQSVVIKGNLLSVGHLRPEDDCMQSVVIKGNLLSVGHRWGWEGRPERRWE